MFDRKEKIAVIAGISGEAITKELQKINKKVFLICGKENESGADIADDLLVIDLSLKDKIKTYLNLNNIDKVILATGHILAFELCKYLEDNKILISVDTQASLIAKDKTIYKNLLKEKSFLTPRYIEISQNSDFQMNRIMEKISLPCVVKSSIDKLAPQLANNEHELKQAIEEVQVLSSVLLEEYIVGVDCTIPVVCNYKEVNALLVSYYSKAKECNLKGFQNFHQKELTPDQEKNLKKLAEDALKETGIIGMARLDVIVDKFGRAYILECNSVMVTGVHQQQIEYGTFFLQKENINFAELLVKNALLVFEQRLNMI